MLMPTNSDVVWKPIRGYEGSYEVSSDGRVRGVDRTVKRSTSPRRVNGVEIKPHRSNSGYKFVLLRNAGKQKPFYIHRLVAAAFVPNPNGLNVVNHIDEDKDNNCADNLEWCSHGQNMAHAGGGRRRVAARMKPVSVIDADGHETVFESIHAAASYFKCDPSHVSRVCRRVNGMKHIHGLGVSYFEHGEKPRV